MSRAKQGIITFKVDEAFLEALRGVRNRSEFIREAVLQALDLSCPLCGGSGVLSPRQKSHWDEFSQTHSLSECEECREVRLVCSERQGDAAHSDSREERP